VPRRRSARALNNDVAIRDAAIELILSEGIDAISFRDVGRVAGLTHGALYARFEDVEELLVDLWCEALCHEAVDLCENALGAASSPSEETVRKLFDFIGEGTPARVATVHVLLTSRRFPILHEEVERFIHDYLESNEADLSNAVRSRALVLISLVIIEVLTTSLFGSDREHSEFLMVVVLESLRVSPDDVPSIELVEPNDRLIPAPKNDLQSQLAYYTFGAVGKSGYTKATISRISRRANCSPGAIYKLYPSKEDLVIASLRNVMTAPWITVSSIADILEVGSLAQLLYSSASTQNEVRKSFTLEVAMASAHSEKLRTAVQKQLRALAALVPLITGVDDEERNRFKYMLRTVVFLTLGVSFLSTITKATDQIDFNQFAEPLRRSLLKQVQPSWLDIRRQLQSFSGSVRPAESGAE
jgi:AcrR family transcriptional regulator